MRRIELRRIGLSLLVILFVVFVAAGCGDHPAGPPGTSYIVGDSLVYDAEPYLNQSAPNVIVDDIPGSSLCGRFPVMQAAADAHARVVVASFVGNPYNACAHDPADTNLTNYNAYRIDNFLAVAYISTYYAQRGVPLYWAGYPAPGPNVPAIIRDNYNFVISTYQYWAKQYPGTVHYYYAGNTVAPNGVFTKYINGQSVRAADELHLTPYGSQLYAQQLLLPVTGQ